MPRTRHAAPLRWMTVLVLATLFILWPDAGARAAAVPAAAPDAPPQVAPPAQGPVLTRVRFHPRAGLAERMKGGRFTGSNTSATNDFHTLAEIADPPSENQWTELAVKNAVVYRFIKYESPSGGWGNVAEVEFYSGDRRLTGTPFGTIGSRDNKGNDFSKALDGNVETFFDGAGPNGQYVGLDLGAEVQVAEPKLSLASGSFEKSQEVAIACATPGATIRYSLTGNTPSRTGGKVYAGPITVDKSAMLLAIAFKEGLADSIVAVGAYRIGQPPADRKTVVTYHIGNSLTDTIDGWLEPVAQSAGHDLRFHRFTIPGAPTEWLWDHPGTGFGDSRFAEAFLVLAPIDHIFTQPFAGHNRSLENEADRSGRFFDLCRKYSPNVQPWLYIQWPDKEMKDPWAQGKGAVAGLNRKLAATWQEGVANHVAYDEALRAKMMEIWKGKPILIVPGGPALAELKTRMEAGKVPGMKDFFAETFADGIHLTPKGRYLVALVFYSCLFKESPEGKVSAAKTELTPEQARLYQQIAWEIAKGYGGSGISKP